MNNKDIGITISNLRKSKGLTQKELAEVIFVSQKAISKWETGDGVPEFTNLMELAKVLNVSVDYILQGLGSEGIDNLNSTHKRFNLSVEEAKDTEKLENTNKDEELDSINKDEELDSINKDEELDSINKDEDNKTSEKSKSKRSVDDVLKLVADVAKKGADVTKETISYAKEARTSRTVVLDTAKKVERKSKYYYGHWIAFLLNLLFASLILNIILGEGYQATFMSFTCLVFFALALSSLILSIISILLKNIDGITKKFAIFNIVCTCILNFILIVNMIN